MVGIQGPRETAVGVAAAQLYTRRVVGTAAVIVTVLMIYLVRLTWVGVEVGVGAEPAEVLTVGVEVGSGVVLVGCVCRLTLVDGGGSMVGRVLVTGGRVGVLHSRTLTTVVVDSQAVRVTLYVTVVS